MLSQFTELKLTKGFEEDPVLEEIYRLNWLIMITHYTSILMMPTNKSGDLTIIRNIIEIPSIYFIISYHEMVHF